MHAIALDDSKIQRKLLARYFTYAGIPEDRVRILGGTTKEIQGFVDWAFDFIEEHDGDYFLFIIDENLDVHEDHIAREGTVSGSLCVSKLRQKLSPNQERRILTLIRSANDSADDVAIYSSRAHGHLPKAPIKPGKVLEELAPLWLARFPPADDLNQVSSDHPKTTLDFYDSNELATAARDLIDSVASITRITSNENCGIRWAEIWEKLHVLKGDLLTLSNEDNHDLSANIEIIDAMKGSAMPPDFAEKWQFVSSKIIAALHV